MQNLLRSTSQTTDSTTFEFIHFYFDFAPSTSAQRLFIFDSTSTMRNVMRESFLHQSMVASELFTH